MQDLATPHNNLLIKELVSIDNVRLKLWYVNRKDIKRYQWSSDISELHTKASFYGDKFNPSFLYSCLCAKNERFLIVGWMNINTVCLHVLFFLLRRPYNYWTDLPAPLPDNAPSSKKIIRWMAYKLLRFSRCKVFCVGRATVNFFLAQRFPQRMLVNLPIFVDVKQDISGLKISRNEILRRYKVPTDGFLLSAGSRLIFDKGYDLLISSISELSPDLCNKVKLVIVGSGAEKEALSKQISLLNLTNVIHIENWLDITDFISLIANSDIFLHPARFDSYGGSTLGMALNVPVIGSNGAGAAVDRIDHGVNGFLYEATDIQSLAGYITKLLNDTELRQRIGDAGRKTALQWHPSRGVDILLQHLI